MPKPRKAVRPGIFLTILAVAIRVGGGLVLLGSFLCSAGSIPDPAVPETPSPMIETLPLATSSPELTTLESLPSPAVLPITRIHRLPHDGTYHSNIDAYLICTDPQEMQQGSHYGAFSMEGGLVQWESCTFFGEVTILGQTISFEFDYAVHNGKVVITYVPFEHSDHNFLRIFLDTCKW